MAKDFEAASHSAELKMRPETFRRIDYKVGGIGSGSCLVALLEKYELKDRLICRYIEKKTGRIRKFFTGLRKWCIIMENN